MGKEIYENFPAARNLFERANQILGFPISKLCFEGPENELSLTINAQPAIFVTSLAIWEAIKTQHAGFSPSATCGLSLGEFSSLVAAGALKFEEGLKLVQKRGEWMHEAGQKYLGTMCSVIGLDEKVCEEISRLAGVGIANYNSPDQMVLSGTIAGIEKASLLAKEKGAKKVIPLKVSGAFHSTLMKEAQEKLTKELARVAIQFPHIPFLPNVLGDFLPSGKDIRACLSEQVTHSVRWTQTIRAMYGRGIRLALEMGPGKVLKGLAKRTVEDLTVNSAENSEDIQKILALFTETTV